MLGASLHRQLGPLEGHTLLYIGGGGWWLLVVVGPGGCMGKVAGPV